MFAGGGSKLGGVVLRRYPTFGERPCSGHGRTRLSRRRPPGAGGAAAAGLFLVEREGMTQAEAALAVGVRRQTVNVWPRRCRERGEGGVLDGRRVSPRRGEGRLTAEEAGKVRGWVAEGTPDRLGLPFALRTSRAVRELVERRFGRRLGLSTVQLYLQR